MNTRSMRAAVVVVALAAALAACGTGKPHPAASADAQQAKKGAVSYLGKCVPVSGVAQVQLGKSLLTTAGRQQFAKCLAIPPQNRTAFEGELVTDAEKVKWTSKDERHTFFTVTLPAVAEKYHNPTPASAAPAASAK